MAIQELPPIDGPDWDAIRRHGHGSGCTAGTPCICGLYVLMEILAVNYRYPASFELVFEIKGEG